MQFEVAHLIVTKKLYSAINLFSEADHIRVCGSKDSLCEYRLGMLARPGA